VVPLPIHHFGEFRLDSATRALWRADEPVALPPKVFDCIVYLLEHRERAVGRDELIAAVWGKVDVADSVLGQTILLARRALDDTGREQQMIRTIVRFGYHWLAAVDTRDEAVAASAAVARVDPPPVAQVPGPVAADSLPSGARGMRPWIVIGVLLIASGLALLTWRTARVPPVAAPTQGTGAARRDAALVLPVAMVGDSQATWVRLGVMDLVASRLRDAGQLIVPSDNVVALARAYEQAAVDPRQLEALADAADAHLVVDARAEVLEGHWRVSLRTLLGRTPAISVSAEADDVLTAAREATDHLAVALGLPRALAAGNPFPLDPLVQEIEAALLEERIDVARRLLGQATAEQRALPVVRYQLGRADFQSGELDAAEVTFRALADSVPAADDPVLHAQAVNAIGGIALQRKQPAAAIPEFDRAIGLLDDQQAPAALGKAYGNRAAAHAMLRDYTAALADLAQSRIALAKAGDMLGLAVIDSNVGALAMNRERFAEAAPILEHSADRFAAFHAYAAELNARGNAAVTHLALLDPTAALASADRMKELVEKVQDPERRRAADLIRVQVLYANGLLQAAGQLLREVRAGVGNDAPALARAQAITAYAALAHGDPQLAEHEAAASLAALAAPQDARETGLSWLTLVRAQLARGDIASADRSLADAQAWAERDGSATAVLHVGLAHAERAAQAGEPESDVRSEFERILADAERERVPTDLLTVSQAYFAWLIPNLDTRRASTVLEGLAAWADRDYEASLLRLRLFHAIEDPSAWQDALARARALAGERAIPAPLSSKP
jgi:DNA-binding winged helix-turn-helix (wHTH) protein